MDGFRKHKQGTGTELQFPHCCCSGCWTPACAWSHRAGTDCYVCVPQPLLLVVSPLLFWPGSCGGGGKHDGALGELVLILCAFCMPSLPWAGLPLLCILSGCTFAVFQSDFPELVLTVEERQLLEKEGVSLPTCGPLTKVSLRYSLSFPNRLGPLECFSQSRNSKVQDGAFVRALVPRCCVQGNVWQGSCPFPPFEAWVVSTCTAASVLLIR